MAAVPGRQQSIRKALKTVGLAKINGDFKALDASIAKATNHDDALSKEKYVITILNAVSSSRPRAEVVYCINALVNRISKTRNWKVALKTLIVVHRAMREVGDIFYDALIKYSWSRGQVLDLSHLWDESSPSAWNYSAWVRTYSSYLEERLECFRILKFDVQKDHTKTKQLDTPNLLRQLPPLQLLLSHLLDCQPQEGTKCNVLIQCALSMVAGESAKLYAAITDGIVNLVDKFFEMQCDYAIRAVEIYKNSGRQAERLSEFFEICRSLEFGRGLAFVKIKRPPASFLTTMENYVKEVSSISMLQDTPDNDGQYDLLTGEKQDDNIEEKSNADGTVPEPPRSDQSEAAATPQVPDLLSFDDFVVPVTSELDEKNSLALAIVQSDSKSNGPNSTCPESSWEIALFTAPSSNGAANPTATAETKLADGLDSLYDGAAMSSIRNQNEVYHPAQASNPFGDASSYQSPFYASSSSNATSPSNMQQQQQQLLSMGHNNPTNIPSGNPFI